MATSLRASILLCCVLGTRGLSPLAIQSRTTPALLSRTASRRAASLKDLAQNELPDERLLAAVEQTTETASGAARRTTAADVASAGGLPLEEARAGLVQLAALLADEATLEVDSEGEIAYSFSNNPRTSLRRRNRKLRWRGRWQATKPYLAKFGKITFGVGLVTNVVAVWAAVSALSSASSRSDDDRGGGGGGMSFTLRASDIINMMWYMDNSRFYSAVLSGEEPPRMGALESIFSYVFGDGDPNGPDLAARQLAAAAVQIRAAGGAVAAEELAPFLDPPDEPERAAAALGYDADAEFGASALVDEQWVLPVVTALGGVPEVTEDGDIVYVFQDLTVTGDEEEDAVSSGRALAAAFAAASSSSLAVASDAETVQELEAPFSVAPKENLFLAGGLAAADLIGVAVLGKQLALRGMLPAAMPYYAPLVAYAVGINAVPLARNIRRKRNNAKVAERNGRRKAWAARLRRAGPLSRTAEAGPGFYASGGAAALSSPGSSGQKDAELARKIAGARAVATKRSLRQRVFGQGGGEDGSGGGVVYTSDDAGAEEIAAAKAESDLDSFDTRLKGI